MPGYNKFFLLLIWACIIITSPLVEMIMNYPRIMRGYLMGLEAEIFFSLPTLVICYIVYKIVTYKKLPGNWIKVIVDGIFIAGIFITIGLLKGSIEVKYCSIYSGIVIISSLLFRVYKRA
jgi:hypothetical protein